MITGHEAEMRMYAAESRFSPRRTANFLQDAAERLERAASILYRGEPVPNILAEFGGPSHLTPVKAALLNVEEARNNLRAVADSLRHEQEKG